MSSFHFPSALNSRRVSRMGSITWVASVMSSASLLLPRECQSLANLSHLARYNNLSNYRMETFTQFNHFYCREGNSSAATVTSRLPSLNLVIIFRKSDLLQLSLSTWRETVEARRARQAVTQYRQAEKLFSDWRLDREKKVKPSEKEVEQFLWLMWSRHFPARLLSPTCDKTIFKQRNVLHQTYYGISNLIIWSSLAWLKICILSLNVRLLAWGVLALESHHESKSRPRNIYQGVSQPSSFSARTLSNTKISPRHCSVFLPRIIVLFLFGPDWRLANICVGT